MLFSEKTMCMESVLRKASSQWCFRVGIADEVLGFIVSFSLRVRETGLRNKGGLKFFIFLSAPSPVTCNSPDVTVY